MIKHLSSLRNKIKIGFYSLFVTILFFSIFILAELNFLIIKIRYSETITDFHDTILEMRRFEKNFFLYGKKDDLEEAKKYLTAAKSYLIEKDEIFKSFIEINLYNSIIKYINEYYELILSLEAIDFSNNSIPLEEEKEKKIRELGKNILNISEKILKNERLNFQSKLSNYQELIIISVIVIWFITIVISKLMSKMVVEPLNILQSSLELITAGRFKKIHIKSEDIEIKSLTDAVNKMLDELDKRQKYLIQSEKLASIGTLVAGIMHEINNPLSNISTSAQILKEEIDGDDIEFKKELLQQIDEQCERAKNIVKSLLEFSRKSHFNKIPINLKQALNETYSFIKAEIPSNISFDMEICDTLFVLGDKQRLQQVFLNLIKNSIEAIGKNEGYIFITAYRAENNNITIEFSDNGPGIPDDVIPRVFDPFFTTKDVGKGSGLGLYLAYEIISDHGGTITLKSEEGKGTVFFITLPEHTEKN